MKTIKCKIKGCNNIYNTYKGGAHRLCRMHYKRWLRYGSPYKYKFSKAPIYFDDGCLLWNGYAFILCHSKRIKRCREIMSKHLGRKLNSLEIVHHINKNKLDDRLENLQIVSRAEHINIHRKTIH